MPVKTKRIQKGAGACSSKAGELPLDPECQSRITQLQEMKQWLETVLRLLGSSLPPDMKDYFQQGVIMLNDPRALNYIASKEEMFQMVMAKKQELILLIHAMVNAALQEQSGSDNGLFLYSKDVPSGSIPLTYTRVAEADTKTSGCESCLITMEPIEPGKAVKISHELNGTPFSICLSQEIFKETTIQDAFQKQGKLYMKHPLLRDKAYINLLLVQSVLQGTDNKVYQDDALLAKQVLLAKQASSSQVSSSQTGGLKLKRTDKKITHLGRTRTVYVGKYNKQYIQLNRQYVAVSSLTTHKKTGK